MDGMDMSSDGIFTVVNVPIARGFWYGVAGFVGLFSIVRIASLVQSWTRRRLYVQQPHLIPSRPRGWLSQRWATITAIFRELDTQPLYFTGTFSRYFSPLSTGKWLLLALYWIVILSFLWTGTILYKDDPMYAYKFEIIGYRAAWVSVTQIPFIYLLSCKFNPVSLLTGISYERFNWLHRWSARTVFLTVIVHWATFFAEWTIADIVDMELEMMTMVKYGFGAWAVITWMILSGFGFFRNMSYEVFVLQHIAAAATLLWLLFMHVPANAMYNVWLSIAFVAFDWSARIVWGLLQNTHILNGLSSALPGYSTTLENLPGDVVRVTIEEADFTWSAGQHVYLVVPSLRLVESHPFTIANAASHHQGTRSRRLTMLVQARKGFTRSLLKAAQKSAETKKQYRSFISGPFGIPPDVSHYETVILIACSTGATFTLPLLQDLVRRAGCVRKVELHWIIRSEEHAGWFDEQLSSLVETSQQIGLDLQIRIHVTRAAGMFNASSSVKGPAITTRAVGSASTDSSSSSSHSVESEKHQENVSLSASFAASETHSSGMVMRHHGRPTVESMIRPAVEAALGETAVVVCGGLAVTAQCRTFVAALSDERAVHKGTGAQGIYLYTETYGW